MKKLFITLFIIFNILFIANAQIPNSFKYLAVVRNSDGEIVANKTVALQISILEGGALGTAVYTEVFEYATNKFGIVAVNIGEGMTTLGNFSNIAWASNTHYLKIDIDIEGGTNYQFMGTSQILAVPYALYALEVENKDDDDADPTNEFQTIIKNGSTVTLSNSGGSFDVNDDDPDPENELQTISKEGSIVSLSNEGGSFTDEVNDNDADANNEIQVLSRNGSNVSLTREGGSVSINDADADATNEIQSLSQNGNTITLSNGGGNFTINDNNATNELQTISKTGNIVSLSGDGGGSFTDEVNDADADANNEIQILSQNETTYTLSRGGGSFSINDADSDPENEIQDLHLTGNTLTITNNPDATPIDMAPFSGTNTDNQTISTGTDAGVVQLSISGGNSDLALDCVSKQYGGTFNDDINISGNITATNFSGSSSGTNTGDMENADVVTAYNTGFPNHFTNEDHTKLNGIEDGARADMTSDEIVTAYQSGYTDYFNSSDHTKLDNLILSNEFRVGNFELQFNTTNNTLLTLPESGTLATQTYVTNEIENNALSQELSDGMILIGNGDNDARQRLLHGDATISNTGSLSLTALNSNGTYRQVTVDTKGRIVSGQNPTTLEGYGITNAVSNTLLSGNILIGNSSDRVTDVEISGDATISNSGALTVSSIGGTPVNLGGTLTTVGNFTTNAAVTFTGVNPIELITSAGTTQLTLPAATDILATQTYVNSQIAVGYELNEGFIYVGTDLDRAGRVDLHGDADLAMDGTLTLANSGVTANTYAGLTVDSKGRVTSASNAGIFTTLLASGDLTLSAATQNITHSGATSLTINSTSGYVGVENVRFTGANIGISGDDDILNLGTDFSVNVDADINGNADISGTLGVTGTSTFTDVATFNGAVNINDVINIAPRSTAPSSPSEGDLYVDTEDHAIYCYLDGAWKQLNN